jgi:CRISPR/Cas system-associated exonuclease Cas4 (RecB family)
MSVILLLLAVAMIYTWCSSKRKDKLRPYMLEHFFKITQPVPLCGKPDVVWLNRQGTLIVGDYKSRLKPKVYDSDIIQLSVYRLLLEKSQQKPVANYGYIHFQGNSIKVKLLNEQEVIALYHRYWQIVTGQVKSEITTCKNFCKHCSHQKICS